jgi:hypothetical protein
MRHTLFELPAANLAVKVTTAAEIQIQNNDPFRPLIRIIKPYADLDNAEPGKAARTVLIVYSVSCGRANFNACTPALISLSRVVALCWRGYATWFRYRAISGRNESTS